MNQIEPTTNESNWKAKTYLAGTALGAFIGGMAAYLFARSAQENPSPQNPDGKPDRVPTIQMLGIAIATITLIRQIAELGRGNRK